MMKAQSRRFSQFTLSEEQVFQIIEHFKAIRSVYDAHLDLDERDEVLSIGIFADGTRTPKRVKREAEEAFRRVARFKIDYRKINIIQDKEVFPPAEKWRIHLEKAICERTTTGWESLVELRVGRQRFRGRLATDWGEWEPDMLVARTAARVLSYIAFDPIRVECVKASTIAEWELLHVTLQFFHQAGRGGLYVGTVFRTENEFMDLVRACLDAINRQIDLSPYIEIQKRILAVPDSQVPAVDSVPTEAVKDVERSCHLEEEVVVEWITDEELSELADAEEEENENEEAAEDAEAVHNP
jgi:hypothetical protein